MLFDEEKFNDFYEHLNGASIAHVWLTINAENLGKESLSFDEQKEYFLNFLSVLLHAGKIRIGKNGSFLNNSIEEQINQFRLKMPKTEIEWENEYGNIWFLDDECPGGIVWISENGYEDWTQPFKYSKHREIFLINTRLILYQR